MQSKCDVSLDKRNVFYSENVSENVTKNLFVEFLYKKPLS